VGSIQHILGAEFASIYTNDATHIPYRDGNLFTDVNSKLLSFGFASLGSGNAMYQAGKIQWIAVASEKRHKKFPNVPTIQEATGRRIISQSWLAFFIKKDTPNTVKQQLEKDIRDAVSDQRMQLFLTDNYFIPLDNVSLTQFVKQVEQEKLIYKNNLKRYKISLNQ
jgi:tripartite-type tricarboxylate transporter receptor subunit TctC